MRERQAVVVAGLSDAHRRQHAGVAQLAQDDRPVEQARHLRGGRQRHRVTRRSGTEPEAQRHDRGRENKNDKN